MTIGISVYNAAETLPLTLRSVFCQTFADWELLLVDDGSTDESVEIMRSVKDARVRVFVDGEHKTTAPRANEIDLLARGSLVARMDADDIMHPDRLKKQVDYLQAHPEVDVVGTAMYSINPAQQIQGWRSINQRPASEFAAGMRVPVIHGTVVARTAWFIRNRYDESAYARRCEDAELWFRTYGTSVVRSLSEPLLFVTEDVRNTMRKLRSSNKGRLKIMFLGKGEVRKKQLSVRLALAAAICLKMAFYELCWAVGARQYLIDRRNQRLDTAQAAAAAHTLEEVLRCPVPGLDPAAR
ncbi:MAG: hypothetical protein A2133_02990 [Actinobacteria bacterium RBG_16_64_13]|nr:MAG: hypothetical protein A2133_02990 [Actinobacteria bacterium RBG_16_64_13]